MRRRSRPTGVALALACAVSACVCVASAAAGPGAGTVPVTFLAGEQVVTVQRPGTTVREAVNALIAGPTAAERAKGYRTQVPATAAIRDVRAASGLVTIDMNEAFAAGKDAEGLSARLAQLVLTVAGVPTVQRVQVLVKGGVPLGLFPGIDLAAPITAKELAAPDVPAPVTPPPTGPAPKPDTDTRSLQQRLADLGYLDPAGVDGKPGPATTNAVMAFQKWEGLGRDGVAGPQTLARLDTAARPTPLRPGTGRRVEVLLDRQLALLIDGGTVTRALPIASGAAGYETPQGSYTIQRKYTKDWSVPYEVWLPWASYFVGGVAFHEGTSVPPQPASHGCVRLNAGDAKWLYDRTPVGTPVLVLGSSR